MVYFCGILFLLILIIGFNRAYKNTKKVVMKTVHLTHSKLPIEQLNILHLSDLHLENISVSPNELLQTISDKQVDLIALTGDFLDRKKSIPKLIPYIEALASLKPRFGMYAVFGNHDYFLKENHFEKLKIKLEEYECMTLQNQNYSLNVDGVLLNIIGIDDNHSHRSDLKMSYQNLEPGYNLVLTHDPNIVLNMENYPFDYLLSGHFHGGQILWPKPYHLFKMGKLVRLGILKGLHYSHGKPFYISEGLGQTGVNIRIGSRPEITFHQIS